MKIVVMGVSGCGKSSLGAALAEQLGIPFLEGDALHPPANVEKMRSGTPLTDDDRWPWLTAVAQSLADRPSAVVSCSALKRSYRDHIRAGAGGDVRFIHLAGSRDLLARRMQERPGHYMPVSLLDSQLATLEPPGDDEALTVDIGLPPDAAVAAALDYVKGRQA
ncbi:MAG: gluconokinase [Candidatus Devosia phytovorans]|uniref:Gluconokinase n=1 Tax=Candidatus Devosia phytovorans TaxID=3121372 RepID=A0AAJ5VT77_9HYPH|nr:gluconokinase [Devosia sp.]WEK02929.1 MAG: gluconokinase [Devosia sp.]